MDKRVKLLGTSVDAFTFDETIEKMIEVIKKRQVTQHVVLNANKINLMYKDEKLKKIIEGCGIINADGQSVVWADRLFNHVVPERVTGIDLFEKLVEVAANAGFHVFYLGATQDVVEKVIAKHKKDYPELQIAGYRNGYFDKEKSEEIVKEIADSSADILFLAIPSPDKEYWLDKYKESLNVPLLIGVGGSFDVVAGKVKRAPKFFQKMGLEWFYRFIQEPHKMFKRYFFGNLEFIGHVIAEKRKSLLKNQIKE
ncbi:MAG: WecB/TagA/CpsF family glycosyltransferase [Enterococcus faecium]|uniref:WecB/TagA/CpsF family glycosyltransferase n=1 Tax=Enterococcus faecium TaxID=1352 RepID=UPI000CF03A40|nr:WecB/TagA/CpsF family glycosyltransferase [Enterococcus faecium]EGP5401497.1 glycosyltransferase [Enterococcus faecium]EGP5632636.1 glycosyltransferase [Enterococcus faecium]MBS6012353.1 WecB/TagA/CpsF family glycosyltransferase [Enterococcus faecium]PQC79991.1 glycosyltransferase [Enterococcus faecium]